MTRKQTRILDALAAGPLTVPQLDRALALHDRPAIGHDLHILERAGLVHLAGTVGPANLWERTEVAHEPRP